jgi:hypothetical protein
MGMLPIFPYEIRHIKHHFQALFVFPRFLNLPFDSFASNSVFQEASGFILPINIINIIELVNLFVLVS